MIFQHSSLNPYTHINLTAKNLQFCIKLFNYAILFAQETFNASASYRPVYTIFCLHYMIAHGISYHSIYIKFYLGMDNFSPYKKGLLLVLKSFAVLHVLAAMFNDCVIKTTSSDAESREEQDGSKHSFVGRMTAELQAILQVYVTKNTEKKQKPKILALLKKAAFPASFTDKDHQNRNFMVSNKTVILLLLG